MEKYVIIGGNAAGMSFAAKFRRNNPDIQINVIEKRDYVSFGSCGLPYFVGDMFSDSEKMMARSKEQFEQDNINIHLTEEVINVDKEQKKVICKSGLELEYDKLIISSGARPRIPDYGNYNKEKVSTLFDLKDGLKLKELVKNVHDVTVIGGGYIGLEAVDMLVHLNKKVTLIHRNDHILNKTLSPEFAEKIEASLSDKIDLKLNTHVESINDSNNNYILKTNNGEISSELIIVSVGFIPNSEFIDVDKSENGAIIVNRDYETSEKDIYAIGDCALTYNYVLDDFTYLPLATNANKLGRMLADKLSNKKVSFKGMLGSSAIKILDYEVGVTGINSFLNEKHNLNIKSKTITTKNHTAYYPGQADLNIKMYYKDDNKQIVGCEMIGESGAVLRVDSIAVAILNNVTTDELGYIDFCYAPPFASTWDALNVIGNVIK